MITQHKKLVEVYTGEKKMKKAICLIILVSLTTLSVFAQDYDVAFKNGLSFDGSYMLGSGKSGVQLGFGFGLFEKEHTPTRYSYLRNHITSEVGYLGSNGMYVEFADSLIYGGQFNVTKEFAIRLYTLLGFGFSMFAGDDQKTDWTEGFMITPRGGMGFEFMYVDNSETQGSFFLETMANVDLIVGDGKVTTLHKKYPIFEDTFINMRMGIRIYF